MNIHDYIESQLRLMRDVSELLARQRPTTITLPRSGEDATPTRERPTEPELAPPEQHGAYINNRYVMPTASVAKDVDTSTWQRATKAAADIVMTWPLDRWLEPDFRARMALADAVRELVPIIEPMAASIRERVATKERERTGPPAIVKLAEQAQRLLDLVLYVGRAGLISRERFDRTVAGINFNDLVITIEAAKREDAELQQLRRIAETTSEYFVAKRMMHTAKGDGSDLLERAQASKQAADAKNRLFDLLAAWRNPSRPA